MKKRGGDDGEQKGLTSRRELVTDCLFWGACDRPVMGFLLEVQAFCWTGGCLCGRSLVNQCLFHRPSAAYAQRGPGSGSAVTRAIDGAE